MRHLRKPLPYIIIALAAIVLVNPYTLGVNQASVAYLHDARAALSEGGAMPAFSTSSHPRARYWNALAALRNGDFESAIHLAAPLSARNDEMAIQIVAKAYEQSGNFAEAVLLWQKIGDLESLLSLAEQAAQKAELDIANQAYLAAYQLNPKEATTPFVKFLLEQMHDSSAAQALLEETIQRNPLSSARPYWLLTLAELQTEDGRWAEAASSYRLAIENAYLMVPGERKLPRYYIDMAWALYQDGQIASALKALDQALATEDFELSAAYLLRAAQIYEAAGETAKAIHTYRRVLELIPDDQSALQALQRLGSNP